MTLESRIGDALYGGAYSEAHEEGSIYGHLADEQDRTVAKVIAALANDDAR